MHKCKKCGREYEGVFCPDCGEPFEKICPQCGKKAEEGARFCNSCGYSFEARRNAMSVSQPDVRKTAEVIAYNKIMAAFFKYAVVGLFVLLSLLMFAFYAAPVDVDPLGLGLSSGNVYPRAYGAFKFTQEAMMQYCDEFGNMNMFKYIIYMLLGILPPVGVLYAITIICMAFTGNNKMKKMETGVLFYTLIYIALAVYMIFDVQKSGMKVGAASILIIAFSAVFFVIEVILLIVRKTFYRNHPEYDVLS